MERVQIAIPVRGFGETSRRDASTVEVHRIHYQYCFFMFGEVIYLVSV